MGEFKCSIIEQTLKLGFVEKGSQTKTHETTLVCLQTKIPDEHPRALTRATLDIDLDPGARVSQAKLQKKEGRALAAAAAAAGIWGILVRGHRHI